MKTWIKVISAILIIGFAGVLIVYFFVYNKPHTDYEKAKPEFTLNASDLYQAFITDKIQSGKKYNGKVIEVAGKLSKVETADSLTTCVFVFAQGMFGDEGVRCAMLPKFKDEALGLSPGLNVRLKGFCTGYNDTDVILDKCSILK
jgi:hypothetical protein